MYDYRKEIPMDGVSVENSAAAAENKTTEATTVSALFQYGKEIPLDVITR